MPDAFDPPLPHVPLAVAPSDCGTASPVDTGTLTNGPRAGTGTLTCGPLAHLPLPSASATPIPDHSAVPLLPGYEILPAGEGRLELGAGGMGVVYKARQITLNRVVALKAILGSKLVRELERQAALARFRAEAEAVATVRHPNVVQVYEYGEAGGQVYMALEFCPHGSLAERPKPLPPRAAAELAEKIARGVGAGHEQGIIHRDMKPANVLFDAADQPKVADFGLAKSAASDLTATQATMGTPAYMAPEQASGGAKFVGPPADVWAVGMMLYELLSGRRPFEGEIVQEILNKVLIADPPPLLAPDGPVPRDLAAIVSRCLAKEPGRRYPTGAALADDLRRFLDGQPVRRSRGGAWAGRRAGRRWAVVAVALAGVALAGWWAASRPRPQPEPPPVAPEDPIVTLRKQEVARRVAFHRQSPPPADRPSPHPVIVVDQLPPPDRTGFHILDDERLVDLRAWRRLRPGEDPMGCRVVYTSRQRYMKTTDARTFAFEGRTMGADLRIRLLAPNPASAKVYAARGVEFVGRQAMKVQQVHTDVSDVPAGSEFDLRSEIAYYGSLQNPDEQWFGILGYRNATKKTMPRRWFTDRPHTHKALDDALGQGELFCNMLAESQKDRR